MDSGVKVIVLCAVLAAAAFLTAAAAASEARLEQPDDIIYLVGGDVLKGVFLSYDEKTVYVKIYEGEKLAEKSYPREKVRRILRLLPSGASKQVFPRLPQDRLPEKPRPKKAEPEKPEPQKPEPVPVSPETREEYAKRLLELRRSQAKSECGLGEWCEKNGMSEEAGHHYLRAHELDGENEKYKRKCGYAKIGGRWVHPDEVDGARAEQARQNKIDKSYEKTSYRKFMGIWVAPEFHMFMENQPDESTKLSYLTALASLAKRRSAMYDDLPVKEKRLLHFLAPLEQKRICSNFDPARMPAPPTRPRPEFDGRDLKKKKETGGK